MNGIHCGEAAVDAWRDRSIPIIADLDDPIMSNPIHHNTGEQRLELRVDGILCVLEYQLVDTTMTITHTGVPPQLGGRGLAGELTVAAFTAARANGWRVVPACSYATVWIVKHPEFNDVLA